jgi:hypothetical protein
MLLETRSWALHMVIVTSVIAFRLSELTEQGNVSVVIHISIYVAN